MKKSMKILSLALAVVLVFSCGIGATLAYLSYNAKPVTNTFVAGSITDPDPDPDPEIPEDEDPAFYLKEHVATQQPDGSYTIAEHAALTDKNAYNIIPNTTLAKDPFVHVETVTDGYLFIEVVNGLGEYMDATVDTANWTKLGTTKGAHGGDVYVYNAVKNILPKGERNISVLTANTVTVKDFNNEAAKTLGTKTLDVYAYLTQAAGQSTAQIAWDNNFKAVG